MKKITMGLMMLLTFSSTSFAVPTLQVGAPGATPGTYAPYVGSTSPTESETAATTGNFVYIAGAKGPNAISLGGGNAEKDWSTLDKDPAPLAFNTHGAILMITYATNPSMAVSLMISTDNGNTYHGSDVNYSNLFFPNLHAPLQDGTVSGYSYFDIGNFGLNDTVPNFADPNDTTRGEIKEIFFQFMGVDWAHFDVMAIETDEQGNSQLKSTMQVNPGSHDVTWKEPEVTPVPEPGTVILFGLGMAGLGFYARCRRA